MSKEAAKALYMPPFKFIRGYIYDAHNHMVADNNVQDGAIAQVRGWGRISYMKDAAPLQDCVGHLIAEALTKHWELL